MGLTIHYNGRFKEGASLSEMTEEVKEIADVYKWEHHIYENSFPEGSLQNADYNRAIYGITVTPPQCEPLYFCFLSNGRMSSEANLKLWGRFNNEEKPYLTMLSTKTQYAGPETHKLIIHLLKYVEKKYLKEFEMFDETGYWETGDEKLLKERFEEMNLLLDQIWFGLENFPKNDDDESFETYFERLLKSIHNRRRK